MTEIQKISDLIGQIEISLENTGLVEIYPDQWLILRPAIIDSLERTIHEQTSVALRMLFLRKSLGYTQEKMAREFGVSFTTWNRWENGRHKPTKLAMRKLVEMEKIYVKKESLELRAG